MASQTFLKLSRLQKHMFIQLHDNEKEPFISVLIRDIPNTLQELQPHQKFQVYEGIGFMVGVIQE